MSVRVGARYKYFPVLFDKLDRANKPYIPDIEPGSIVKVINLYGAPKANTMGMCYIEKDGKFAGMVMTNSLQPLRKK